MMTTGAATRRTLLGRLAGSITALGAADGETLETAHSTL
jgi:hypothetical protein